MNLANTDAFAHKTLISLSWNCNSLR